ARSGVDPPLFEMPLERLHTASYDRRGRLEVRVADRLRDDLVRLLDRLVRGRRAPPEAPGHPTQNVGCLPRTPGAPRVLESARPGSFRIVGATKPRHVVPAELGGPGDALVVVEVGQLTLSLLNFGKRISHPGAAIVLDLELEVEKPCPVVDPPVAGLLGGC